MELTEAIRTRRSIRRFKPDPVPEDDIWRIIELAGLAPSASNAQMWKFWAVTNRDVLQGMKDTVLRKLEEIGQWPEALGHLDRIDASKGWSTFFTDAPVTIVVLGEPYSSAVEEILEARGMDSRDIRNLRRRPDMQSLGAAIEHICLVAHDMGYGTCWMTAPMVACREIEELLGVSAPWEVVALIPLGLPDYDPPARPRKPVEEVLEFIR